MKLGAIIRFHRERLELTQVKLARLIGVGSDVVSKYERDVMVPRVKRLQALARIFGITLDELCNPETKAA